MSAEQRERYLEVLDELDRLEAAVSEPEHVHPDAALPRPDGEVAS